MGAHSKVDLACTSKPYTDVVWRSISSELVRGASRPRRRPFLWAHLPPFSWFPGRPPLSQCHKLPFYTNISFPFFTYVSVSPCLGWLLVLSILTSEWLGKAGQHNISMGLSGDGLHIKALAAFSLVLILYWICPFLQASPQDVRRKVVLGHILGSSRSSHCASLAVRLLGLGLGF